MKRGKRHEQQIMYAKECLYIQDLRPAIFFFPEENRDQQTNRQTGRAFHPFLVRPRRSNIPFSGQSRHLRIDPRIRIRESRKVSVLNPWPLKLKDKAHVAPSELFQDVPVAHVWLMFRPGSIQHPSSFSIQKRPRTT